MSLREKLPLSYLLFTTRGRISRRDYCVSSVFIWSTFYVLYNVLDSAIGRPASLFVYPLLFWALFSTSTKRLHDLNRSSLWLLLLLLPILGPVVLVLALYCWRGTASTNRFGVRPRSAPDYFVNPDAATIPHLKTGERIVNDVTQLNPVIVSTVLTPKSVSELQEIIANSDKPISIGGGRFSMGGQTASPHTVHLDLRKLNSVLAFSAKEKLIKVQAGIRWSDIQRIVDESDLSVKIMQTYANFTVGGSLSVNCHGRYIGLGPLILSVRSLDVILANGELVHTSPNERPDIFFACVGCYNAIAVIAHEELELVDNVSVKRTHRSMKLTEYKKYFKENVRSNNKVVFHNGDIYPPAYKHVRAVSWVETDEKPTTKTRRMPLAAAYPLERYFMGAFSKSSFGKWRREHIVDPIIFLPKRVHPRNYEAGYDVLELEPVSREHSTYVLQEYFVPVENFDAFTISMAEVFQRHNVNVINVSIRHSLPDSGSLLAWAREEVFAFVVWYKQGTSEQEKSTVAVWTRELIDAVLAVDGCYYLPYQPHATSQQFFQAYPRAGELFELKKQLDPSYKFRNVIWDTYYAS